LSCTGPPLADDDRVIGLVPDHGLHVPNSAEVLCGVRGGKSVSTRTCALNENMKKPRLFAFSFSFTGMQHHAGEESRLSRRGKHTLAGVNVLLSEILMKK
jgi:hypothetical protein